MNSFVLGPASRRGFQNTSSRLPLNSRALRLGFGSLFTVILCASLQASPVALDTNLQIRLVLYTTNSSGAHSTRIAKDPRNNQLYYLKDNGDIFQVNLASGDGSISTKVYSSADHGIATSALGMAIGPDGTIYIVGNTTTNSGNSTFATVMQGVPASGGGRGWSTLARTEAYPKSRTAFDHLMSGLTVSPDGKFLYLNSGSRTDHGEIESTGGLYPGLRETGLTAKILRLPLNVTNLVLTNDLAALRAGGYVFAEGTRNSFSLGFSPSGELFGTDNGPDRDMSDELNWIRPGLHFGFPWRMGGADNPQQFPNYDPSTDLLLDHRFVAVASGTYQNDPTFPPPPTNFFEPVINLGPDANSYRDPADGSIRIASAVGRTLSTVTAHRSPLGLVFDVSDSMAPPYREHGFMLSWTQGDPSDDSIAGPFKDASQDMVDLDLTPLGTNYQARITRIVGGFSNPIDAAIISNRVYVIEYGGDQGIWEVTFPAATARINLTGAGWSPGTGFEFSFNTVPGTSYTVLTSSNLVSWSSAGTFVATNGSFHFNDQPAAHAPARFYRVVSP
ncbi:MAG TPA: PQQ-dependent sugar dehydrogenase [Verrucomicrobiae bacterium]|nr:PQQ-dependent sugar dehydrogenase [Verrucomicrobiae bacterium]